ncbi:MAG: hypothetical protein GX084_01675 [Acholeplasmataceae bacterium]|jgi:hypothetical protein|nr:hypothetical protein [Acidaminococcaceae bacterium]NLY83312.1 hypothetical protein [Acholeplasmataceae bacterium]
MAVKILISRPLDEEAAIEFLLKQKEQNLGQNSDCRIMTASSDKDGKTCEW